MNSFDYILLIILAVFIFAGWRKGFLKKIIALVCLGLALILATKYAAPLGEEFLIPLGVDAGFSTILAYILIVCGIMLIQAIIYRIAIKKIADGLWNKIGGGVIGLIEGAIILSMLVLFLSIYFHFPSQETRATSALYLPVKNFAPRIFDSINTFFPESEDFYEEMVAVGKKLQENTIPQIHQ
ncbi:MAG TPA: CvpA family protein [Bacteroidota bacterium]|nr:CvpA family protein [Bacteroidota bacterium]